jgi:hypothetical protein
MMIAIMSVYLVLLFALVRLGLVTFNLFWKASPFIVLLLLSFGLFIPMGWGAPQGVALVVRNSVSIVPNVAGEVIDVPVEGNTAAESRRHPVPHRSRALRGAGAGARSPTEIPGPPVVTNDVIAGARFRPGVRCAGAAI